MINRDELAEHSGEPKLKVQQDAKTKFDPSVDPSRFIVWEHRNTFDVMGPADTREGACWSRKVVAITREARWAYFLCGLLNGTVGPDNPERV